MSIQEASSLLRETIAGHSVFELAEKYGTPTYVYDANRILQQIEALKQFDTIRFAQKANSNIAILDLVRRHGVVVDAVSMGEMHRAKVAGYDLDAAAHEVVYTADIFDRPTLDYVLENNVAVNAGSPDMIRQFGEKKPGADLTLRINPGFGHGHTQKTNTGGSQSKHGIWHEQVSDCLAIAREFNVTISGIHMHIGSGTDFEHLSQVCSAMAKTVREVGDTVRCISAGGGLPTPYKKGDVSLDVARYFELWDQTRKQLEVDLGHPIGLEIEPGRYLVAEAGYLLTEIRAVKQMGENRFYLVDAGFNNLARPIMYGAYHPMSVSQRSPGDTETLLPTVVGGPLCESGDIFTQNEGGFVAARDLPLADVGDMLTIECAGAYGAVMSSNYNSKPFAAEILLDRNDAHLIRRRQSNEDLIAGESIPD